MESENVIFMGDYNESRNFYRQTIFYNRIYNYGVSCNDNLTIFFNKQVKSISILNTLSSKNNTSNISQDVFLCVIALLTFIF